jgi:hypothetical protein
MLEARAIREERPPHNRNRRHLPRLGFVKMNPRSTLPRLAVTHRLGTDRSLYVGPFPNLHQARRAQKALARVFGLHTRVGDPLPKDVSQYRERVEVFRAFVEGAAARSTWASCRPTTAPRSTTSSIASGRSAPC